MYKRKNRGKPSKQVEKVPAPLPAGPPPSRWVEIGWWIAVILTCWSFGFTTMQGSDLWWHMAAGRWILAERSLHFADPFSYTCHGFPWFHPEWFADVVFYGWAKLFGEATLVWWKWGVIVGAFALLFRLLRQICGSSAVAYLGMLAAIAVGAPFFDIRPQLYTVLGYVVVLALMLPLSRWMWSLPLVFMLWANLHSGIMLGLAVVGLILFLASFYGEFPRRGVLLGGLCLLGCLLNGNGLNAIIWPIRFAMDSKSPFVSVAEWLPPYEPGGIRSPLYYPAIAVFVLSIIAILVSRAYRRQPRVTLSCVLLGFLTLAMSMRSRRFIPLFGITQSLLLAPALMVFVTALRRRLLAKSTWLARPRLWQWTLPVLALLFGAWRLSPYPLSRNAFLYLTAQDSFPVEAMSFVEANQLKGKIFALYNWGGYVELRDSGRLRVFIDGRAGTVYNEKTYLQYLRVLGMHRGWEDIIWDSGADFVLWPKRNPKQIEQLLASQRWRTLYSDNVAALLVRADRTDLGPMKPTPDSPWRSLAQGWSAIRGKDYAAAETHFQSALQGMPSLRPACEWLALARARLDRRPEADRTLDHCQRMFPDPGRRKQISASVLGDTDKTSTVSP
jgi:hypothetical protein